MRVLMLFAPLLARPDHRRGRRRPAASAGGPRAFRVVALCPASKASSPAKAIIAALSVHSASGGATKGRPASAATASSRARSCGWPRLAAGDAKPASPPCPPARGRISRPAHRPPAAWKLAQRSARSCSVHPRPAPRSARRGAGAQHGGLEAGKAQVAAGPIQQGARQIEAPGIADPAPRPPPKGRRAAAGPAGRATLSKGPLPVRRRLCRRRRREGQRPVDAQRTGQCPPETSSIR